MDKEQQKNQYFVEYSEQYGYWDVLTVEYPVLSGVEDGQDACSMPKNRPRGSF